MARQAYQPMALDPLNKLMPVSGGNDQDRPGRATRVPPISRNTDAISPQPPSRPPSRTGGRRPGAVALSITRRQFSLRLSIERGSTAIGTIDTADAQAHDAAHLLNVAEHRNIVAGAELAQDQGSTVLHVRMHTARVLVLDTLRGLTMSNLLRILATRTSALAADHDGAIHSVPRPSSGRDSRRRAHADGSLPARIARSF